MKTKRKVLCFFILIFWILAICTILSTKIEQLMVVQVATVTAKESSDWELPLDSLILDENGYHLYEVVESDGWESGKRVSEVDSSEYMIEDSRLIVTRGGDYSYIQYASKPFVVGSEVQSVHLSQGQQENYLAIGNIETKLFANTEIDESLNLSVIESNKEATLLSMTEKQPYMESKVKKDLSISEEHRIYNLTDIKVFLENIPLLTSLAMILILSVILWGVFLFSIL